MLKEDRAPIGCPTEYEINPSKLYLEEDILYSLPTKTVFQASETLVHCVRLSEPNQGLLLSVLTTRSKNLITWHWRSIGKRSVAELKSKENTFELSFGSNSIGFD